MVSLFFFEYMSFQFKVEVEWGKVYEKEEVPIVDTY